MVPRDPSVPGLARAVQRGERVFLRRPTLRDEREFLALRRASAAFLAPWEPLPPPGRELDDPAVFASLLRASRSPRVEKLLVCGRGDGALLGVLSLNEIVRGVFQSAFLGYWVGAAHAGRGAMTAALQLGLRHAFETLGLHRVEANIKPDNAPSIALVKRAGFRREGFSPRYLRIAGAWADHERWALLADEWTPLSGR